MATVPAILGAARLGNFRLGYESTALAAIRRTRVHILLAGIDVRVRVAGLSIRDVINDTPNSANLAIHSPAPTSGQALRITLNSDAPRLLFAGTIQTDHLTYEGKPTQRVYPVIAIDDTDRVNKRRPFGTFTNVSATTVAQTLVSSYAPGFSASGIAAALPTVTITFDGETSFMGCLVRLANLLGGYCNTEDGVVSLFLTDTSDPPDPITTGYPFCDDPPITVTRDDSQLITRCYGKGHAEATTRDVAVNETALPVMSRVMYNPAGGQVIASTTADGAASQILAYTGLGYEADLATWETSALPMSGRAVAWSPELALFVAVNAGGLFVCHTSPDGITWTARTLPATVTGQSAITWSSALNLFVAVSDSGTDRVATSPDGITWTARTAAAANAWKSVVWAPALNLFVAVSLDGANRVMTSPNGTAWTSRAAAAANGWSGVTWAPSLGLLVAVAQTGATNQVMTSPDGITWTARAAASASLWISVAWAPALNLFAAVANGGEVMTSPDGTTWTAREASSPSNAWNAITWGAEAGVFLAVAGAGTNRVMSSANGILWTDRGVTIDKAWFGVTWAPALALFVAVSSTGGVGAVLRNATIGTLTGVTLALPIAEGSPVHLWVQRDDLPAQAAAAARESTPTYTSDGIHEVVITDGRLGQDAITALCDATLARFSQPIITVVYATRDVKSKSGKPVTITLVSPAISETLVIQDVTISEIDVAPSLAPKFTVTASSVRFSLEDTLRRLITAQSG